MTDDSDHKIDEADLRSPINKGVSYSSLERPSAVFINPAFAYPIIRDKGAFFTKKWPPLSLAYSAALAEANGWRVRIIDAHAERLGPEAVADRIGDARQIFISTSPLDRWQCPVNDISNVYEVIRAVRGRRPESRITLSGPHGTTLPEKILAETEADAVILGEPELTVLEIASGKPEAEVEGLAYRLDGRVVVRPKRAVMNLNDLPLPAFHLLPMEKYEFDFLGKKFAVLEGSRGCLYRCSFCYKDMYGPYRSKTSRKMIEELQFAVERFGVRNIYFADLTFTLNKKLVNDLCQAIIDRGYRVRWACQTRLDLIDEPILAKMSRAGCRLIEFGVESGTETIVRRTNKYIPPKTITEGLKTVHKFGIESVAFMMFGLPKETAEDMKRSVAFVKRINPTYAAFNITIPYTETRDPALFDPAAEKGVFFPVTWGAYSLEFMNRVLTKALLSFYLRPRAILNALKNPRALLRKFKIFLAAVKLT